MTLEELFAELEKLDYMKDWIVRLQYKYEWEDEYTISNEVLEVYDGEYWWLKDWNEGQTDVTVLGYIDLDDVAVLPFTKERRIECTKIL